MSEPSQAGPSPANSPKLTREIAGQAAQWFVRMAEGNFSKAEQKAFDEWHTASPVHALAWQRAMQISGQVGKLPAKLASDVLRRPQNTAAGRRAATRTLAMLIIAAPASWFAWRSLPWPQWRADYATTTGEQRELELTDGTQVMLDTASAIDVIFDSQQRTILLHSGAILIRTAADPLHGSAGSRPFTVQTPQGQVRAIGTRFSVRQDAEDHHVAVFEGAVEVTPRSGQSSKRLNAGQQARFNQMTIAETLPVAAQAAQWARGVLAVEDMRLADFVQELSRYRQGLLQCDPAIADLRITGAFQLSDTDAILTNLTQLLPIQVRQRTRYWVTLVAVYPSE